MKLLLCLGLVALVAGAAALTDDEKEAMKAVSKACQAESGVSQEGIEKARNGEVVEDPKMHQHALCMAKKLNMMTKDGEMNMEVIRRMMRRVCSSDEETQMMMDKCLVKKDKPEDTAFNMIKCAMEHNPKFSPVRVLDVEERAMLNGMSRMCRKESGATEEMIKKARRGEMTEDPAMKKQMLCMMMMMGMMDGHGEMMMEVIKAKVMRVSNGEKDAQEMMARCCLKKGTPEETAFDMMKCMMENRAGFHMVR